MGTARPRPAQDRLCNPYSTFVTALLRLCYAFKFKIPRFYRGCNGVTAPVYVPVCLSVCGSSWPCGQLLWTRAERPLPALGVSSLSTPVLTFVAPLLAISHDFSPALHNFSLALHDFSRFLVSSRWFSLRSPNECRRPTPPAMESRARPHRFFPEPGPGRRQSPRPVLIPRRKPHSYRPALHCPTIFRRPTETYGDPRRPTEGYLLQSDLSYLEIKR